MKILLLGEYSNVHNLLAKGLRTLGHEVCVASNGDFWKNYPRDIDLQRELTPRGTLSYFWRLLKALPRMRGYDVVQIINPMFLELKAERILPIYRYIRRHNGKIVMGAFGMDYYWTSVNTTAKPLRYSDFNIGPYERHDEAAERERHDWIGTAKQHLNQYIAHDCDGIAAGLYEYWVTYRDFASKMRFIPFPIEVTTPPTPIHTPTQTPSQTPSPQNQIQKVSPRGDSEGAPVVPLTIFIGISRSRSAYKGTDIMLEAAERLQRDYPTKVSLRIANGVPYDEYQHMMDSSDCLLDQLYSYTPAMNGLLAMSKGIILVGGGEPENYDILEPNCPLRPIVNVLPVVSSETHDIDYELSVRSCYDSLKDLLDHPERIPELKRQSVEYIQRYHDHVKVAQHYIDFYNTL